MSGVLPLVVLCCHGNKWCWNITSSTVATVFGWILGSTVNLGQYGACRGRWCSGLRLPSRGYFYPQCGLCDVLLPCFSDCLLLVIGDSVSSHLCRAFVLLLCVLVYYRSYFSIY